MKVLVVDDSVLMRHVLVKILTDAGVTSVIQAGEGKEALQQVAQESPDLIFMDWIMPTMSGIEAVREIRASGNKVPIIMCTTETEKNRVIEAMKAGANNFVIKPFEPETIIAKAKETLKQAAS